VKKEVKKEVKTVDETALWEKSLPELKFSFYDFKTEYVNATDKA